jgi:hypothetical protein
LNARLARLAQFPVKFAEFWVAVAAPVSAIVTCAVDVRDPVVGGTYCTRIVQLAPGARTVPDAQVPPVTVKVPAPVALLTTGAAVSVSGPAFAPVAEFLNVTVPVFVVPLAGVVVKAGVGPVNAAVPPVTVNGRVLLVPPGVVRPRFLIPSGAAPEMFRVAVTVVGLTTVRFVTGIAGPMPVTAKVPVRLVPVNVTVTLVLRAPDVGVIDVSVGGGGAVTVNVTGLVIPPGVETLTLRAPVAARLAIVKVVVTVVSLITTRLLTVTPVPVMVTAKAPVRFVPVSVTGTAVPLSPVLGAIDVSVGGATELANSTAPASTAPFPFLAVP